MEKCPAISEVMHYLSIIDIKEYIVNYPFGDHSFDCARKLHEHGGHDIQSPVYILAVFMRIITIKMYIYFFMFWPLYTT